MENKKKDMCKEIPVRGHPSTVERNRKLLLEKAIESGNVPGKIEDLPAFYAGVKAEAEVNAIAAGLLHPASKLKQEICGLEEKIRVMSEEKR